VNSRTTDSSLYWVENASLSRRPVYPLFGIENQLIDFARHVYETLDWPGVILLMAIESACIPFPSEVIMPLAGWFLVDDKGRGIEWLFIGAFFGALGNTIGSLAAYYAGMWGGRPLLDKYGKYILITRKDVDLSHRWFTEHGELMVLASRVMPVFRTFISLPAGIARMDVKRFTVLTFIGSYPWSLALIFAGYELGSNWEDLTKYFRPFTVPFAIAFAAAIAYFFYHRIRQLREEGQHP